MLKKPVKQQTATTIEQQPVLNPLTVSEKIIRFFSDKKNQLILIIALIAVFYGNSISNDYALDDTIFITDNHFVQQGINGIPGLITKESMYGYTGNTDQISGGRWRPLSLITFAIEKQFFGQSPHISHFINLLLLALTGVIMILFLGKFVFRSSPISAFLVTLLFVVHPIHTEAVTNIKSRDELLSWLFLLLTLYCSMNFIGKRNYWQLLLSLAFYCLGLLSKENGIVLIAILPLSFYFFTKEKTGVIIKTTLPFAAVLVIYILIRTSYVPLKLSHDNEVMNAPYLYATAIQHNATSIMMLGKYILLLFWPNPLSSDYSYNQIPYVDFSDWGVWLSALVQIGLLLYALVIIKEKNIVSYGILFYFFSIFLVSNLVFDVGTFIGERFLYQPSFGFCIAMVALLNELIQKIKFKNLTQKIYAVTIALMAIVGLSGFQTIERNPEWKSDITLGLADVNTAPNSARAQNRCGISEILLANNEKDAETKSMLLRDAITHLKRAHEIQPTYADPWLNMGVAYVGLANLDSAEYCGEQVHKLSPRFPKLEQKFDPLLCTNFIYAGLVAASKKDYATTKKDFYSALKHDRQSPDVWYNLGGLYFTIANYDSARIAWENCLKLNPDYSKAKDGIRALPVRSNSTNQ